MVVKVRRRIVVTAQELRPGPPTPEPVRERPPQDRFCDLVLTGGIASGIVYPWAIIELARQFRFRRIGGNSVGGMAAAFAAAAEYGRCCGYKEAFEPLRHSPHDLAEEDKRGRTRMLRLFQPDAGVRRLFEAMLVGIRHANATDWDRPQPPPDVEGEQGLAAGPVLLTVRDVLALYGLAGWWLAGVLVLLLPAIALSDRPLTWGGLLLATVAGLVAAEWIAKKKSTRALRLKILGALLAVLAIAHLAALVFLAWALGTHTGWLGWTFWGGLPLLGVISWTVLIAAFFCGLLVPELRALKRNEYGLCPGRAQPDRRGQRSEKAIVEWLHEGIQRSAGREREDPPLTFADLWAAPRGVPLAPGEESISLQVFSTNVTLGRPVVWPLRDPNLRLFFCYDEWARIFPPTLLDAVWKASRPYRQENDSDPRETVSMRLRYREIPAGGMPIAVAARLTLSFPVLFSCIPVYAIDYEQKYGQRVLRRCLLSDGGVCTNFPIHLFDQAHPKWPTFGLLLSRRIAQHHDHSVWLPDRHGEGRADNWSRGVPGAELGPSPGPLNGLVGLLVGMLGTALRWNDNLLTRLPQVRNRVLRMALKEGEGQLHLTMSRDTLLRMAHEYGTAGGVRLVDKFVGTGNKPTVAWQEHLYVRAVNELRALVGQLRGYGAAVTAAGFNKPLARILRDATDDRPLRPRRGRPPDDLGNPVSAEQHAALLKAVQGVAELEQTLKEAEAEFGPYRPVPETRFHLRSPI
jgi:predicted acylesterase/phospholipase RssA